METSASSHNFALVSHHSRVDKHVTRTWRSPSKDIFYKFALAKSFNFRLLCRITKFQNALFHGYVVLHIYSLSIPAAQRFNSEEVA